MKSDVIKRHGAKSGLGGLSGVLPRIQTLIESSRQHVVSTANLTLVWLYWNVGRVITQDIQQNQKRAGYGEQLLAALAGKLARKYGRGFSRPNLQDMRRFFESFEIRSALPSKSSATAMCPALPGESFVARIPPPADAALLADAAPPLPMESSKDPIPEAPPVESENRPVIDFSQHHRLGWTHYRILLGVEAGFKRAFYFDQAARQRWTTRELQRQVERALFERVALSRDTKALVRLEKRRGPVETVRYEDAFKDPYLLDFLGLKEVYSERDLESAIVANLQQFLTELGSDFCFIARQFPMRIDDDDYRLDLLFFHRRLRCLVAIDLKIGPFAAADKGQMDLYLSWLKRHEWRECENEPVGLILCTSKKQQHVELLLSHGPHKMQVSEYLTQLPSKRVLAGRLKIYSRMLTDEDQFPDDAAV